MSTPETSGSDEYHEVAWTEDQVARFWDFYGRNAAADATYYSHKHGARLLALVRKLAPIEGPVLDLGCGPGHLLEMLLDLGYEGYGVDESGDSVAALERRVGGRSGFLGAHAGHHQRIPLDDGAVRTVFSIEVLEHLSDEKLAATLGEVRRVLQPGGHLVATVPHDENLAAARLACPECGAVFHNMQHQQSFDAERLAGILRGQGFDVVLARALNFRYHPQRWFGGLVEWAKRNVGLLGGYKLPHLVLVARRRAD